MKGTRRLAVWAVVALGLPACTTDQVVDPSGFGVKVQFLTDDGVTQGIPPDLSGGYIEPVIIRQDGSEVSPGLISVQALTDPTYDRFSDPDHDGVGEAVLSGTFLPVDEQFSLKVSALLTTDGPAIYSARVDGLRLKRGERRFVTINLLPVGRFTALPESLTDLPDDFARFGASVTTLTDGRVLVAGGFDLAAALADGCATAVPGAPAGSLCFNLVASKKAFVFTPHDGRMYQVASEMTFARALHSAAPLPNGRAVVAGGTDLAVLVFRPFDGVWTADIVPVVTPPIVGYHNTFEIFNPSLNALPDDPYHDGNPERGGFDPPGALTSSRLLAAAAVDPAPASGGRRVLLFGGMTPAAATARADNTWEIIDDGSGVWAATAGTAPLTTPRFGAAAGTMNVAPVPELWVVGGAVAPDSQDDLVEKWYVPPDGSAPNGMTRPVMGLPSDRAPSRSFVMPMVAPLGRDRLTLLVAGSAGPLCTTPPDPPGGPDTPSWTGDHPCSPSLAPPYTLSMQPASAPMQALETVSGWDTATDTPHVLGAAAALADGSALLVGGAADLGFVATNFAHRITEGISARGFGQKDTSFVERYPEPVLLPGAATTLDGDAVFVGGVVFVLDTAAPRITLSSAIVVFNAE